MRSGNVIPLSNLVEIYKARLKKHGMVDLCTSGALRNEMRRIVLNRICEKMDGVALENPLKKTESQRIISQDAKAFALKFAEENVPQDDEQEIGILRKSAAILRRHVLKFRQKHQSKPENFKVSFDNTQQDYPAESALFLEGETAIILGLTAMNIEQKRVTVYASDSDLFALLLMDYSSFNCHELHMKSLTGYTSITAVHEFLGHVVAEALLSFHALNGCDTTGKFSGKSKEFWTKRFVQERNIVSFIGALNALQDTGPSEDVVSKLASFICRAYCTNRITNDLAETRYFLYKTFSSETNFLQAILQHVLRAFCQIGVWKSAHLSIIDITNVIENGWEVSDGVIMPVCSRCRTGGSH